MSHQLISLNPDLKRLRDEGYFIQIVNGLLVMRDVPYVNSQRQVLTGTLISTLLLAGEITQKPEPHTIHFDGEYPCRPDGTPFENIRNQTASYDLGKGLTAKHLFSSKPKGGYVDYYQKMTTYASLLAGAAAVLKPGVTAKTFRVPEQEEDSVFNYTETASDRVGIGALTALLEGEVVAIIGVGGTGSYVLDLVAKTPVRGIHLFDADEFLQHNAFRAPGAPSLEQLREAPKKVDYLAAIYSRMRRGIVSHPVSLCAESLDLLNEVTFAFICIDGGSAKKHIVQKLESTGASFVDVGMGLQLVDGTLGGILRTTTSTPIRRDHVHQGRISFADGGADDIYATNIQVADLNALNAALAVIKWKKIRGFYRDLEKEHYSTYTTDGNALSNDDLV